MECDPTGKPLTFGEERPMLPYPPERMVGVWTVRGGWSINWNTHTSSSEIQHWISAVDLTNVGRTSNLEVIGQNLSVV